MRPVIDHLHVTVRDLRATEPFYDRLLPLFGYDLRLKEHTSIPEHEYESVEYHHRSLCLGFISPRTQFVNDRVHRRKPGAVHHIAFLAESKGEVDRLYQAVQSLGASIVAEPRLYPEYCPDYYAFFFKDPNGIKLEVVYYDKPTYF